MKAALKKTSKPKAEPQERRQVITHIPNEPIETHKSFDHICHDMYKRFGAVYTNLKGLAITDAERVHLSSQLHDLRTAVRELLEQARKK